MYVTGGDVVEGNAGAGVGVLDGGRDAVGVTIGGDGEGAGVVDADEGGGYVLSDGIGVVAFGNTTVVNVPPHRNLGRRVSCGCMATHHLTIAFIFLENQADSLPLYEPLPYGIQSVTTYSICPYRNFLILKNKK